MKGKEEFYIRHLLKYGAGVALTGSGLVVLWEMQAENEKRAFYRAVAGMPLLPRTGCGWGEAEERLGVESPDGFYVEQEATIMGRFSVPFPFPEPAKALQAHPGDPTIAPQHIDLDLDQSEINNLLQPAKPPALELKTVVPLKSKKARKIRSLRGWGA